MSTTWPSILSRLAQEVKEEERNGRRLDSYVSDSLLTILILGAGGSNRSICCTIPIIGQDNGDYCTCLPSRGTFSGVIDQLIKSSKDSIISSRLTLPIPEVFFPSRRYLARRSCIPLRSRWFPRLGIRCSWTPCIRDVIYERPCPQGARFRERGDCCAPRGH